MEEGNGKGGKLHSPQPKRGVLAVGEGGRRALFRSEEEGGVSALVTEEISKIVNCPLEQSSPRITHDWRRLCALAPERETGNPLECDELFIALSNMDGMFPWDSRISTP